VRDNDGLVRVVIGILSGQHVDFSLIDAQLANVNIQEEDIGALHTGIKELGNLELVRLFFAHDGCTFLNPGNGITARDIHDLHPILVGSLVDFLRRPNKFDIRHLHPGCLPYLNKIFSDGSDLL
jgi:hypothetical protein